MITLTGPRVATAAMDFMYLYAPRYPTSIYAGVRAISHRCRGQSTVQRCIGRGELACRVVDQSPTRRKRKNGGRNDPRAYTSAVGIPSSRPSVREDKSSCNQFDRLVHIRRAHAKENKRKRKRRSERTGPGETETRRATRIRMTSFIDQSCLSHTLRLVCKTNYWKESPAERRGSTKRLFHIYIRDTIVQTTGTPFPRE